MASAYAELVIVTAGRYELDDDGAASPTPSVFVMGPRPRARTLLARGPVSLVAARFTPWGASALLGVTGDEVVGRIVPAGRATTADLAGLQPLRSHTTRSPASGCSSVSWQAQRPMPRPPMNSSSTLWG